MPAAPQRRTGPGLGTGTSGESGESRARAAVQHRASNLQMALGLPLPGVLLRVLEIAYAERLHTRGASKQIECAHVAWFTMVLVPAAAAILGWNNLVFLFGIHCCSICQHIR